MAYKIQKVLRSVIGKMSAVLQSHVADIRENYRKEWFSTDVKIQQQTVALYFTDKVHPPYTY